MFLKNKFLFIFFAFIILVLNLETSSWPNFRFNKIRSGSKQEVVVPPELPLGWSLEVQGEIVGSCVVKDDIVFFAARDLSCWALDAKSGNVLWQYSTSGKIEAVPTVWKDYVYVLSYDGKLYCFKKVYNQDEDCLPLWTYNTHSKSASSVLVIDDEEITGGIPWLVFVSGPKLNGIPEGFLYILNAENGGLIRKISIDNFSYSSIAYSEGNIYFAANNGKVYCYSLTQEEFLWQRSFNSCFYFSSVVVGDNLYLYAGDIERKIYILDKNTSDIIWVSEQLSKIATDNVSICLHKDKLILNIFPSSLWEPQPQVVFSSQTVLCISTSTKQILWRKDFNVNFSPKYSYNFTSAATVIGNVVFFGTYVGNLYALDLETAEIISQYEFSSPIVASVVVSNGWLYFGETKGKFYGIKADKFLAIKNPDEEDVVINFTTINVISEKYLQNKFSLECINLKDNYSETITSSTINNNYFDILWNTKHLPDGRYKLNLKISPTEYVENTITIDNSPFPPTNVSAIRYQKTKIFLSWYSSLDEVSGNKDVRGYNIYYSTNGINYKLLDYVLAGNTFYIHTPEFFSTTYYYKLTARDKSSESDLTTAKFVYMPSLSKPQQPLNFKLHKYEIFITSGFLTLAWEKPSESSVNIVKYNIYRKINNTDFVLYDSINVTNATFYYYKDTINISNTYYYTLRAISSYDVESDSTSIVSFYSFGVGKPLGARNFYVFDTPNDNGGSLTLEWLFSFDENSSISKVTSYRIYKSSNNINYFLVDIIYSIGKTTYTYIDIDCPLGVTFYYYITSLNQHGFESDNSEIKYAYSAKDTVEIDTTPPKAPSFITAFDYPNDDGSKIFIVWTLSEDEFTQQHDVIKYNIYRSSTSNVVPVLFYQISAGTSWFLDTEVVLGVTYYYFITALDKFLNESEKTATVLSCPFADGVPSSVKNLKVTQIISEKSAVEVLITWNKSIDDGGGFDDVEWYQIFKSTDALKYDIITELHKGSTSFIDTEVQPQQIYYYYVVAVDKDGYKSLSSEVSSIITKFGVLVNNDKSYIIKYTRYERRLEVFISQNSFPENTYIEIVQPQTLPEFYDFMTPTKLVYSLLPNSLKVKNPLKLKFYYYDKDIQGLQEEKLRVFWYDFITSNWKMLDSSKVYIDKNYIEADIYSFGLFVIAEFNSKYSEAVKDEYVYTFPSPAKGEEIYFKFLLYQNADIKIYVYDIVGDIVWQSQTYSYNQQDVGKTHLIKWDIKNLAPGTYLFRLEAKTERSTKNVIKKFSVIH